MKMVELTGDWPRFRYLIHNLSPKLKIAIRAAARRNALLLLKEIKKGIRNQNPGDTPFTPLSPITIFEKTKLKGVGPATAKKALVRHSDLINAFSFDIDQDGSFWVGIKEGVSNRYGVDLNMISSVMQTGFTISVTQGVRDWFAANGMPLRNSTTHLDIPARPFLEPVWEKHKDKILQNYIDAIDKVLQGKPSLGMVIEDE